MTGGRAGWYVRRLRAMGPAEVAWRAGRAARDRAGRLAPPLPGVGGSGLPDDPTWWERELAAFRRAEDRPLVLDADRAARIAADAPAAADEVVAAAERVLEHRVEYFGLGEVRLARPVIDWHHDPVRDVHWPRVPSHRVQHRVQRRAACADPKWIWELNRLQHLPWLAQAWLFTGRDEFAREALAQLDSWVEAHPVGEGIAWRGAFEAGVRAPSVLLALQGLRDHPGLDVDRFRAVVTVLHAGARACWRERSLHSSANNHLIGEMVGLAATALVLPGLPRADTWRRRALGVLAEQADLQVLRDGASAEQAIGYQVFTGDLLLVVAVLLRSAGQEVPHPIETALRRSSDYLAAVVAAGEPTPRYGDEDDGFALRLGVGPRPTVHGHLAQLAAYGARSVPPDADAGVHWVAASTRGATADGPEVEPLAGPPAAPVAAGSRYAPDGGLVVLRSHEHEHGRRQRVTVDVGPLGHLAIAAHGHADALALTWALDGSDVLVDPGTGSYYGHPDWRTAHRSTAAHATVTVDGQDSSVMAGPFLWSSRARVRTHAVDLARGRVDADHDGYRRLADPVVHRRLVVAPPDRLGLEVLDDLPADGVHEAVVSWPFAPGLTVSTSGTSARVLREDGIEVARLRVAATVPVDLEVVHADPRTHLGWASDGLESRRPAPLLRVHVRGEGLAVATVLRAAGPGSDPVVPDDLEVRRVDGAVVASWAQGSRRCVQEIHNSGTGPVRRR